MDELTLHAQNTELNFSSWLHRGIIVSGETIGQTFVDNVSTGNSRDYKLYAIRVTVTDSGELALLMTGMKANVEYRVFLNGVQLQATGPNRFKMDSWTDHVDGYDSFKLKDDGYGFLHIFYDLGLDENSKNLAELISRIESLDNSYVSILVTGDDGSKVSASIPVRGNSDFNLYDGYNIPYDASKVALKVPQVLEYNTYLRTSGAKPLSKNAVVKWMY